MKKLLLLLTLMLTVNVSIKAQDGMQFYEITDFAYYKNNKLDKWRDIRGTNSVVIINYDLNIINIDFLFLLNNSYSYTNNGGLTTERDGASVQKITFKGGTKGKLRYLKNDVLELYLDGDIAFKLEVDTYSSLKQNWDNAIKNNSPEAMERLHNSSSDKFMKTLSQYYWNAMVKELADDAEENLDKLVSYYNSSMIKDDVRIDIKMAIAFVYIDKLVEETDPEKMKQLRDTKLGGEYLFDEDIREDIDELIEEMRQENINSLVERCEHALRMSNYSLVNTIAESIYALDPDNAEAKDLQARAKKQEANDYVDSAEKALEEKRFNDADNALSKALALDPNSNRAKDVREQVEYQFIRQQEQNGRITYRDYAIYLEHNPNSNYTSEFQDKRVLSAMEDSDFDHDRYFARQVQEWPMSASLQATVDQRVAKVEKRAARESYRRHRGSFVHTSVNGHLAGGKGVFEYAGGLGMRMGYTPQLLNLYVGAEVQNLCYLSKEESSSLTNGGYMGGLRFNVPMELRVNLVRDYDKIVFLGLGATYNKAIRGSYCIQVDSQGKRKSYHNTKILKDNTFAPTISIGTADNTFEIKGYVTLDKNVYDEEYVNSVGLREYLNPVMAKRQFGTNFRVGFQIGINL